MDAMRAQIVQQLQYVAKDAHALATFECNVGDPVRICSVKIAGRQRLSRDYTAKIMPSACERAFVRRWRLFGIATPTPAAPGSLGSRSPTPTPPQAVSVSVQLVCGVETLYADEWLLERYLRMAYPTIGIPFIVSGTENYILKKTPCTMASSLFRAAAYDERSIYASLPLESRQRVYDLLVDAEQQCANVVYWHQDYFSVMPSIYAHAKRRAKWFLFGHALHSVEYSRVRNARYMVRFAEKPFSLRHRYRFDTESGKLCLTPRNTCLPESIGNRTDPGVVHVVMTRPESAPAARSLGRFAVEFANALADVPATSLKTRYLAPTIMAGMLDARNTTIGDDERALLNVAKVSQFLDFEPLQRPAEFTDTILDALYTNIVADFTIEACERHYAALYRRMKAFFMNDDEFAPMLHDALMSVIYQLSTLYFDAYETDSDHVMQLFVY